MSFASDTKTELAKIESKKSCCQLAECYGIWLFSRCFTLKNSYYVTENSSVTTKMAELAAACTGAETEIRYAISRRQKTAYRIQLIDDNARQNLLQRFGATGTEPNLRINRANLPEACCNNAFLRGAFLSCGTVTNPSKEYHLEFSVPYKKLSQDLITLMGEIEDLNLTPAISMRKGSYVIYLKDSRQIEDFLTYLGASSASMELMQVKMYKEMKNDINRKANFETANMDKTYSASARQIAAIVKISNEEGLESLSHDLYELALLRLDNPEMSLRELAEQLGITRSAVNHRMKKIQELGDTLGDSSHIKMV
ncbi:DNA-binding protein WhiA [Scatolibacter rhodanostii]|uniref:DNA-binding protein WhiA n=1 Tax=Scatolibacter rhodanostii TaxID=2014781 RepID=UPI000C06D161|nr:DNA-binding protein WhiA [Scatolibacter rhodanostii]